MSVNELYHDGQLLNTLIPRLNSILTIRRSSATATVVKFRFLQVLDRSLYVLERLFLAVTVAIPVEAVVAILPRSDQLATVEATTAHRIQAVLNTPNTMPWRLTAKSRA